MANNYFQFKLFKVIQEYSAMKVGTDGILLGAWANTSNVSTILDIGTGTGLIALMLAQRSDAEILGIEIEPKAAKEALSNVENSKWKERISIQNIAFQKFLKNNSGQFDLIVSNPPFFQNSLKSSVKTRRLARHNDELSYSELIEGAGKILTESGRLALIIPDLAYEEIAELAARNEMFLSRKTKVRSNANKNTHRYLLEFSKQPVETKFDSLEIYKTYGNRYSEKFKNLTKDFYLKF